MKTTTILIIVIVLLGLSLTGVSIYSQGILDKADKQISSLTDNITILTNNNKALIDRNYTLRLTAYPNSFPSEGALLRWLGANYIISPSAYYSMDAITLMEKAHDDGYYMGITPVLIQDSIIYLPIDGTQRSGGYVVNITVVDGNLLYLVDPTSPTKVVRLVKMQAQLQWHYDNPKIGETNNTPIIVNHDIYHDRVITHNVMKIPQYSMDSHGNVMQYYYRPQKYTESDGDDSTCDIH
jgi:hypothetical protein